MNKEDRWYFDQCISLIKDFSRKETAMTADKRFPVYKSHTEAKNKNCWNCFQSLETAGKKVSSDYPDGKWYVVCTNCDMHNYYDVKE